MEKMKKIRPNYMDNYVRTSAKSFTKMDMEVMEREIEKALVTSKLNYWSEFL